MERHHGHDLRRRGPACASCPAFATLFRAQGEPRAVAHCVSAPRGLAVGDLRHDRLLRRFRRHCRLGQAPSRLPAAFLGVSSRHSLRALAPGPPQSDRSDPVRPLFQQLDCRQVEIADKIVAHKADYLLPLRGNQPTLEADVEDYFRTAPADELVSKTTVEKGHGRIETRTYTASSKVDWITSERSYPGQPRFKNINTVAKVHARAEYADRCSFDTHHYISSAPLDIERIARGARGHWGIESMHWLLDVEFKDDLSRYRTGHGAKNMTIVRRFALGLVRANKAKGSVKTRRKTAGWSPDFLLEILQLK